MGDVMKFSSVFMLFSVFAAAIYTLINSAWGYISYEYPITRNELAEKVNLNITFSEYNSYKNESLEYNNLSDKEEANVLEVSGSGEAKGKIIEKFVSPYGAKYSYQKIFLKNNTNTAIDLKSLFDAPLEFKIEKNKSPQVLIMHTHTTESYMLENRDYYTENDLSRRMEEDKNMIAIGDVFENTLRKAGIEVIHDTTVHDYPSYSGSYDRSAETVKSDLSAYKDIKIVIDIHRDAISSDGNKTKPIVKINGENYAQVMLVMGSETGGVKNYPNWQKNLSFALKYQQKMEEMYPGLARAITLNEAKYNQNLSIGSILLEVGSDANTLEEAKKGATAAANSLVSLLNTQ